MKKVFKSIVLATFLQGLVFADVTDISSFVLTPHKKTAQKKMTANALKEEIGAVVKRFFDSVVVLNKSMGLIHCTLSTVQQHALDSITEDVTLLKAVMQAILNHNRFLGTIQQDLAELSKQCSLVVEKLIDDEVPFKKASKNELENSLSILTTQHQRLLTVNMTMQSSNSVLAVIKNSLDATACKKIQETTKIVQKQQKIIHNVHTIFNRDACLKQCV